MTQRQWNKLGFQLYGPNGGRPVRGRRPKARPAHPPATDNQGVQLMALRVGRWRREV
jgi:hypothetical protein